ncbi:MAG: aminotransferase class III-fold pyridoxal phosphate-dependent enzyme, partial [Pseudomonadota bacterium]
MTDRPIETDWATDAIVERREKYYAATQRKLVPYATPLIFQRGQGQYLWDETGARYIDLLGMNVCISVGHAHPDVVEAASGQLAELTHCTTMFYHPVPAHYAEELTATMPPGHDWVVHFTNSGAEAIDLAFMLARSHTGNRDMLALRNSYHGATFGAQSLTGISGFRHEVGHLGGVTFVPEPNPYRGIFGEAVDPYLDEIDHAIRAATSGRLAGMIIEPVQGYGGIVPMPEGYIAGAFERVRASGGVCIIDEVQSGVGRTGDHFWAFEGHGVVPDIVVMAKGIGNGVPLGAVVARREVAECMADKFLFHTYGANPMACAAGRAVLKVMRDEKLQ